MIKFVKITSYVLCAVFLYAFIGGLTYSVHEHFYPGESKACERCVMEDGSVYFAALWPAAIPLGLVIEIGESIVYFGMSLSEEIINE